MKEYIEEIINDNEQLEYLQKRVIERVEDKNIKQMKYKNIKPRKVAIEIHGENDYCLHIVLTIFNDNIRGKLYEMFAKIKNICMKSDSD